MKKYIFILLLCSSCGSTWVVQGVTVHAPTQTIQKRDGYLLGAGALAGFIAADHFATPEQKEKLRKALGAN